MLWLHRFAKLVAGATLLLVVAGGMVTSTGSGLAVPDWPSSYGYFMFSFPLSKMVGGIFYEHGHRLIASTVGMLTIGLAGWLWWQEPRSWVRRLGVVALVAVVAQGLLGGLTVLYFLPAPISIGHAGLAQIFFCLTVSLAVFTSPGWRDAYPYPRGRATPDSLPDDHVLRRIALLTVGVIYAQILVGATVRHTGAGLAIPDFPLVFGGLWPPVWSAAIAVHLAHRVGAGLVTLAIAALAGHVLYHHQPRRELVRPAVLLLCLLGLQIVLGAFVIWTAKAVAINTAHVASGALVLATAVVLALRAHRPAFRDALEPDADARRSRQPTIGRGSSVEART